MTLHILPGDAQVEVFRETGLDGEVIVCREALIDGPVNAADLTTFWKMRADFIEGSYGENANSYFENVVPEFEKLTGIKSGAEINLWFEYELFCQVNMWFCLHLLRDTGAAVYRVAPVVRDEKTRWQGFGGFGLAQMLECFSERTKFSANDILLGTQLWEAYRDNDLKKLEGLAASESKCFPYLQETGQAAIERDTRPKRILKEIIDSGATEFKEIFPAFAERAGVYGYGDSQVKAILNEL